MKSNKFKNNLINAELFGIYKSRIPVALLLVILLVNIVMSIIVVSSRETFPTEHGSFPYCYDIGDYGTYEELANNPTLDNLLQSSINEYNEYSQRSDTSPKRLIALERWVDQYTRAVMVKEYLIQNKINSDSYNGFEEMDRLLIKGNAYSLLVNYVQYNFAAISLFVSVMIAYTVPYKFQSGQSKACFTMPHKRISLIRSNPIILLLIGLVVATVVSLIISMLIAIFVPVKGGLIMATLTDVKSLSYIGATFFCILRGIITMLILVILAYCISLLTRIPAVSTVAVVVSYIAHFCIFIVDEDKLNRWWFTVNTDIAKQYSTMYPLNPCLGILISAGILTALVTLSELVARRRDV